LQRQPVPAARARPPGRAVAPPARQRASSTIARDLARPPDALDALLQRAVAARNAQPTLARGKKITVKKRSYSPYSKQTSTHLYKSAVVPVLERYDFKAYGMKTALRAYIRRKDGRVYRTERKFGRKFVRWAERKGKVKPFDPRKMSRPKWTEEIKKSKGLKSGDHVRHVVRNATLKYALAVEWERLKDTPLAREIRFEEIARTIGVDTGSRDLSSELVERIYRKAYLNAENLFAGEGTFNTVIGFSADNVCRYGETLLNRDTVNVAIVRDNVIGYVKGAAAQARGSKKHAAEVYKRIAEVVGGAIKSLDTSGKGVASGEEAGELVIDIGLGLGFDFIDGRVKDDQDDIAERQRRLLWSEIALGRYTRSDGTEGDLRQILGVFMGKVDVPD